MENTNDRLKETVNVTVIDETSKDIESDDEDEEEVVFYVEFPGLSNFPLQGKIESIQISDLSTDCPTCRINGLYFEGNHMSTLGTRLVFDRSDSSPTFCDRSVQFHLKEISSPVGNQNTVSSDSDICESNKSLNAAI